MYARSQGIALTALLSAAYVAYALVSSYVFGTITHGADNFIVRSLGFVILAALTTGFGYCTMMGGISGLVLEFTVPTPVRFYLLPSLLAYGFIFDLLINVRRQAQVTLNSVHVLLGTLLASATMSVVALTIFTLVGFFPAPLLTLIWAVEIAADVILGIIGAIIGLALTRQLIHLRPT